MSELNRPLYSLTVGEYIELHQRIFSEQRQLLKSQLPTPHKDESDDIIFIDEVIKLTGYKKPTIYSKISRNKIPILSRNKPLTFSKKAIIEWITAGKPDPLDQRAEEHLYNLKRTR